MEGELPQPQQAEQQQSEMWYTPLTRVTPLSKYLAMTLFVMLPFVGFWLGLEWGKHESSHEKVPISESFDLTQVETEIAVTLSLSQVHVLDSLLSNIPTIGRYTTVPPDTVEFEWRSQCPQWMRGVPPPISKVQGRGTQFVLPDVGPLLTQEMVQEIDRIVFYYIQAPLYFVRSNTNEADHPTSGAGAVGFERNEDGLVCLRSITGQDRDSLQYFLSCGFLDERKEIGWGSICNWKDEAELVVTHPTSTTVWMKYEMVDIEWDGTTDPLNMYLVSKECYETRCFNSHYGRINDPPYMMYRFLGEYIKENPFTWRVASWFGDNYFFDIPAGYYKLLFHRSSEGGEPFVSANRRFYGESDFFYISDEESPDFVVEEWMLREAKGDEGAELDL